MDDKLKILLVDDRPENLLALESILAAPELTLVKATSGRMALREILAHDFALILLDVKMPELDGFQVAELIRERDQSRLTPIIFLTAITENEEGILQAYSAGAVDILFKPINPVIVKSKVNFFITLYRQKKQLEKQAEELNMAKAYTESVINNFLDTIIVVDKNANIQTINPATCKLLGYEERDVLGKPVSTIFTEEEVLQLFRSFRDPKNTKLAGVNGTIRNIELNYKTKDGNLIPMLFNASLLFDNNGKPSGVVAGAKDLTEIKQKNEELTRINNQLHEEIREHEEAKKSLKEKEELFRLAFGQAGVGMALIGLDWQFLDVNTALCLSLGYTKEEMMELSLRILIHEDYGKGDDEKLNQLKQGEIPSYQTEKQFLLKSGAIAWFRTTISLMRSVKGKPLYMIIQMEDVTRRKIAEQTLMESSKALKQSNQELEQFAYIASHDLQEPLRMVTSYVQLLEQRYKGKLDSNADEFIAFAVDGASRMKTLINDLLAYSRINTQSKPFSVVDCEDVIKQTISNLQMAIKDNNAEVTWDPLPIITADETQFAQLFQNLVCNAIKFRDKKQPRIHISARRIEKLQDSRSKSPVEKDCKSGIQNIKHGSGWIFSVRDNGIGIDASKFEGIFIIFQRLHGRNEYPGTGLGLAICKKIVTHHGGEIWVESQPGEGSTFLFSIPNKEEIYEKK